MITKAKLDERKRCLLAISTHEGWTVLHWTALYLRETAVLECLVREHPLALCATTSKGHTPLQVAITCNRLAQMRNILTDTAAALASHNFVALATLVHGGRLSLARLAFPLRLITRTAILICLRRLTYSPDPAPPNSLVRRAHAILPHDMWSEILSY